MENQTSKPCVFTVGKAPDMKTNWLPSDKCVICNRFFPIHKIQCETCPLYAHCHCVLQASRIHFIQDASQNHTPAQTGRAHAVRHVAIDAENGENEPAEQTPPPPVVREPPVVQPACLPAPEPQDSANLPEPEQQEPANLPGPEQQNSAPATGVLERVNPLDESFELWKKRSTLFSRFDDGIMVDKDSFRKVCPEVLAHHITIKCKKYNLVLDPYCGTGSIAIQLALAGHKVIAVDMDPKNIAMAEINAKVYGVADRIIFRTGDSSKMLLKIKVDAVVTAPLWGEQSDVTDEAKIFLLYARDISTRVSLTVNKDFDNDKFLKYADSIGFKRIKLEHYSIAGQGGEFRTFYLTHDTDICSPGFDSPPVPVVKNDVRLNALPMPNNQRWLQERYNKTSTFTCYEKYLKKVETTNCR